VSKAGSLEAITARIRALAPEEWLPEPRSATVAVLAAGAYHQNFVLCCGELTCMLRLNLASQWGLPADEQLRREHDTLADLAGSGVTPRPIALLDGDPSILVEELIAGRPFRYDEDLELAAESIARIHAQPARVSAELLPVIDAAGFLIADGDRWLAGARQAGRLHETVSLLTEARDDLEGIPAAPGGPMSIVNTDLNAGNLIVAGERCFVVDWEAARRASFAWDLAHFLAPTTTLWHRPSACRLSGVLRDEFLTSYAAESRLPADAVAGAVARMTGPVSFRALAWCAGALASEAWTPGSETEHQLLAFTDPEFVRSVLEGA